MLVTVIAAMGYGWLQLVGAPQGKKIDVAERRIAQIRSEIQVEQERMTALLKKRAVDPNQNLRDELLRLQAELEQGQERLDALLDRFVTPERMPALLQEFLAPHPALKLVKIGNLNVEEITEAGLFRHSMSLEIEGEYFDVLRYLEGLEGSQWAFNWRSLDYAVAEHPRARVRILVETLSDERSWIGV